MTSGKHALCPSQVIVEKMVEYLRGVTDDVAKADVVQRISDLAERYAPDTQWFIDTMNQVGWAGPSCYASR
jgi:hypothetical protein